MELDNTINKDIKPICQLTDHKNSVEVVRFNPQDSNTFMSASHDQTAKIWDLNAQKCITSFSGLE